MPEPLIGYNAAQVARMFGVTREAVRLAIERGELPATRHGKVWVIAPEAVARFSFRGDAAGGKRTAPLTRQEQVRRAEEVVAGKLIEELLGRLIDLPPAERVRGLVAASLMQRYGGEPHIRTWKEGAACEGCGRAAQERAGAEDMPLLCAGCLQFTDA